MRLHRRNGVAATLSHLNQALKRIDEQGFVEAPWIDPGVRTQVIDRAAQLKQANTAHDTSATRLKQARTLFQEDGERLVRLVRDFYTVLNRAGKRQGNADLLKQVFACPNLMPQKLKVEDWQEMAQRIVAAQPTAQSLNLPDPVNPTVEDLAAALAASELSAKALYEAQVQHKARKQELNSMREEAQRLLRIVAGRLRESLQKLPAAVRRDMMRTFGFRFFSEVEASEAPGGADSVNGPTTTPTTQALP